MKKHLISLLPALLLCACFAAHAHAQVSVQDAWVRATVPQQKATGAFMRLTARTDMRLVAVSTPLTATAEVHQMAMAGDVMQMRPVDSVDLPAGQTVELSSGGYHLMLMELKKPVRVGEQVPLTLVFENPRTGKRESTTVQAAVRPLNAAGAAAAGTPAHSHGAP